MAGSFPALASGDVLMYPATRSIGPKVKALTMANGFVKRWVAAPLINSWRCDWTGLSNADATTIETFWATQKGAADTSWDITIDGVTYAKCAFDDDTFTREENADRPGRWSVSLAFSQIASAGAFPSATATFPTLSTGAFTQLPLAVSQTFQTIRIDQEAGQSYRYPQAANSRLGWSLSFGQITPTEAETLRAFFIAMRGPYTSFTFTDHSGATQTCRFDQDRIDIRYLSPTARATELRLRT